MPLDPEAAVRNVHLYTTEEFHAVWSSVRDFVLAETLDDGGRPRGHAILRITQAYQSDDDGAFAKATYYQYWVDNDMRLGSRLAEMASYMCFGGAPLANRKERLCCVTGD